VSVWVPRVAIVLATIGIAYGIYSIAVGEGGPESQTIGGVNEVQRLFGGIPQDGAYLGPDDVETTLTVFNDMQCAGCAEWQIAEIDPLVEEYARTERVRMEFRHFASGAKAVTLAAVAAEAAGLQARQWQYVDTFMRNQGEAGGRIDEEFLRDVAEAVPQLELEEWEADFEADEATALVEADEDLALELELPGSEIGTSSAPLEEYSPAVVVSGPGGQRQLGDYPSRDEVEAAIADVS
jgi:hypothetical protein